MFACIFMRVSRGKRKSEVDIEKEQAPAGLDDRMFHKHDCYHPVPVAEWQRQSLWHYYYTSTSAEGRRTAHMSKLISLSSFSAFLSRDKHMPEYDLLPCLSGSDAYSPLFSFLFLTGCLFVHLVEVCSL